MKPAPISNAVFTRAYNDVYEQFAVDSAFLWVLRSVAVDQPHYTKVDVLDLERRIDAGLDGLMTAPEEAWSILEASLDLGDPGEMFAAAVVAFRSLDVRKIQAVVEAGIAQKSALPGLVSALEWLPGRLCHSWIKKFLTSKDLNHKHLGVAACSARREDPRDYLTTILQREDCRAHNQLYASALRLVGELKRTDLLSVVSGASRADHPDVAFSAAWSSALVGIHSATDSLKPFVFSPGPHQEKAVQAAFRRLSVEDAREWIAILAKSPAQTRTVIKAVSALGDPHAVDWLVNQMRAPAYTRLAAEAFTLITGIDLEANKLALEDLPDLDNSFPSDDPADHQVDMNEDENLPFPDVYKVAAIWQKYQRRFVPGHKYFMGKPVTSQEHQQHVYQTGQQRQRRAAALNLAIIQPSQFLLNHAAKGASTQ